MDSLHKKWSRDQDYRTAYEEMLPGFDLARSIISSQTGAGLTLPLERRAETSRLGCPAQLTIPQMAQTIHRLVERASGPKPRPGRNNSVRALGLRRSGPPGPVCERG